jgi:hypothetical protein
MYNARVFDYDIAVLRFPAVELSDTIKTISLPQPNEALRINTPVVISG